MKPTTSSKGIPTLSLSQIITEGALGKTESEPLNRILVKDSMILLIPYHQLCLFMGEDIHHLN